MWCSLARRTIRGHISIIINKPMLDICVVGDVIMELLSLGGNGLLYTKMQQALVTTAPPQQPRCLHPHDPVQSWIVIEKILLKMRGTMAPVNTKVVDQVGGNNVAGPHTHVSREQELPHASIDKLFTRTTILPSLQVLLCPMPRRSVTSNTSQLENPITLTPGNVNHEVPPF
jgi:hypothetical protein